MSNREYDTFCFICLEDLGSAQSAYFIPESDYEMEHMVCSQCFELDEDTYRFQWHATLVVLSEPDPLDEDAVLRQMAEVMGLILREAKRREVLKFAKVEAHGTGPAMQVEIHCLPNKGIKGAFLKKVKVAQISAALDGSVIVRVFSASDFDHSDKEIRRVPIQGDLENVAVVAVNAVEANFR